MGISFSCPFAEQNDVETGLESVIVKSISFGDDVVKTPVRSVSFGSGDLEPKISKSLGSGKMILERSVSFKGRDVEEMMSVKAPSLDKEIYTCDPPANVHREEMDNQYFSSDNTSGPIEKLQIFDPSNPKHQAAIKLQKVYKSFRTRRKLADCAVLVEQSWWKLLDFAELKRSSISFFDIEKHETAISRWSRARTRAAKVGKGLSKNDKAQKLALQHWLEAIDPRHRYGHNLHFYYVKWLHSKSREPFFYWLDIGEGKEVNLVEKCPRSKLQQQCIKYLGPMERKAYEVIVEDGKLLYKQTGELLHTTEDAKWIFVLSTSKTLYVGKKKKGTFQHSSFLAGGVTTAAGRLVVESGTLKAVWPHSGHYRPTEENFKDFLTFLRENNVDLTDVMTNPTDEEELSLHKQRSSRHLRNISSDEDLIQTVNDLETEEISNHGLTGGSNSSLEDTTSSAVEEPKASRLHSFTRKLTYLEIPRKSDLFETVKGENPSGGSSVDGVSTDSLGEDGYESSEERLGTEEQYMVPNENLLDDEGGNEVENVPEEAILERINSKKGMSSYQLGKQLSFKWTTGAGPRIGCVRDYPSELQFRALEQVNLSPRSIGHSRGTGGLSRRMSTPTGFIAELAGTMDSPMPLKCASLERSLLFSKTKSLLPQEGQQWLQ
ncbi:IQ domain-containing protein iqm2 [Turnera subulata]|uniref:IQ domain-containing protein iqm2 n=1 Tax=Turnera subulata TaxID=218843 RepID=A0A9Q0F2Q6_9ROSI|nr:IQ domain-containing protein iqm2 [Turnera subulata]